MKKIKFRNFLNLILFLSLIVVVWVVLALLQSIYVDRSFSVFSFELSKGDKIYYKTSPLKKGDRINGEFKAKDNYLGIIAIDLKANTSNIAINDQDILEFKIKEKGTHGWYAQNSYKSGLIANVPIFPFGFPVIKDSKGKTYDFEIMSTNGNGRNSISINGRNPMVFTKYDYPKKQALENKMELLKKMSSKIINTTFYKSSRFLLVTYIISIIFLYILYRSGRSSFFFAVSKTPYLKKPIIQIQLRAEKQHKNLKVIVSGINRHIIPNIFSYKAVFAFFMLLVMIYILNIKDFSGVIFYFINLCLIILSLSRKPKSWIFFFLAFIFLISAIGFNILKNTEIVAKICPWVYSFMVIGALHMLFEIRNSLHEKPNR